ncbi:MAG: general secretion pathway protein GspB, partial [Lentisphaeria bacterium]
DEDEKVVIKPVLVREDIKINYTGYLVSGEKRIALINGNEYSEGEIIRNTKLKLVKIELDSVVLSGDEEIIVLHKSKKDGKGHEQ